MNKHDKRARQYRHVRPGSTLRVEVHLSTFCALTGALSCEDVGELMQMLMAEAAGAEVEESAVRCVNRAFARRDEYRRIRGGFGRSRLSKATRQAVFERDGGCCSYCGQTIAWSDYHCDHIEPLSKGGSDDMANLTASCRPCNLAKAAKLPAEWNA